MKLKLYLALVIIILGVAFSVVYFLPLSLSDTINKDSTMLFTKIDITVSDGQSFHEATIYNDVTEEQKDNVLHLLSEFSYSRNIKTLFSDGSMSDNTGDGYLYITIYNQTDYAGTIVVAHDDEISLNNKNYTMNNSSDFINSIIEIIVE